MSLNVTIVYTTHGVLSFLDCFLCARIDLGNHRLSGSSRSTAVQNVKTRTKFLST